MAEGIVKVMPIASKEKEAYLYYRKGLAAQNDGDYSEALEYYEESLKLEDNQVDRGETLKNMAIIYMSNGDEEKALNTYKKALEQNPKQPSCLKNMGLIYEKRGRMSQRNGNQDEGDMWFDQAADVWTKAVRLYPGGYLDIENWLKTTGRGNVDVYLWIISSYLLLKAWTKAWFKFEAFSIFNLLFISNLLVFIPSGIINFL